MRGSTAKKTLQVPYMNDENHLFKELFSRKYTFEWKLLGKKLSQYIGRSTWFLQITVTGDCTTSHGCEQTSLLVKAGRGNQPSCTWTHLKTPSASLTGASPSVQEWQLHVSSTPTLNCRRGWLHQCCGKFPLLHTTSRSCSHEKPWKLSRTGPI